MKSPIIICSLTLLLAVTSLYAKSKKIEEPSEEQKFLQNGEELTNLRTPGAKPFHLMVKFHAYPGMELVPDNKRQIITGDGTYEETWMDLHRWRREVTFGAYHAVETDSGLARKMQASSDYEPVRVLMLLEALLYPVPKDVAWPLSKSPQLNWKMERNSVPSADQTHIISFINVYRSKTGEECGYYYSYLFLANGLLVQRNDQGLAFDWQDQMRYGEKIVARHIIVQAGGRDLLTAEVSIEPAGTSSMELFDLPGNPAEPGMTLRPIHSGEAKEPEFDNAMSGIGQLPNRLTVGGVITRQGETREFELIDTDDSSKVNEVLNFERHMRYTRPAMIDNSPCEYFENLVVVLQKCSH